MRKQPWLPPVMALIALAVSTPLSAQPTCEAPTTSDWLRQPPNLPQGATVEIPGARPITIDIPAATRMLANRPLVALTEGTLVRFAGAAISPNPSDRTLRPYLVRAVFPTPNPSLTVRWSGNDLHVFARGLGCSPFTNHPILVFLDRKPARVFVTASAAL